MYRLFGVPGGAAKEVAHRVFEVAALTVLAGEIALKGSLKHDENERPKSPQDLAPGVLAVDLTQSEVLVIETIEGPVKGSFSSDNYRLTTLGEQFGDTPAIGLNF